MTWIFCIIRLIALGSVPLPGQQLKVFRIHRSGILDAGNLIHFCDIFEPPQWGLRLPSKRNFVPFTNACRGLPVYIDRVSFPKHGADLLCRGQLYLCYVCLNIDSEYRVLESEPVFRFFTLSYN